MTFSDKRVINFKDAGWTLTSSVKPCSLAVSLTVKLQQLWNIVTEAFRQQAANSQDMGVLQQQKYYINDYFLKPDLFKWIASLIMTVIHSYSSEYWWLRLLTANRRHVGAVPAAEWIHVHTEKCAIKALITVAPKFMLLTISFGWNMGHGWKLVLNVSCNQ